MNIVRTMIVEVEIEVDADYKKGTQAKYDASFGNFVPGDPSEIHLNSVILTKNGKEVLPLLGQDVLRQIEEEIEEAAQQEE